MMAIWRPEKKIHNGKSFTECETLSLWSGIRTNWKWNIWWVWIKSLHLLTFSFAWIWLRVQPKRHKICAVFCDNPIILPWLFLDTQVTKLPGLQPCEPNSESLTNWTNWLTLQCNLIQAYGIFLIWSTL